MRSLPSHWSSWDTHCGLKGSVGLKPGMVVYTYNPSTAEAKMISEVQGQSGFHETLSQNQKK